MLGKLATLSLAAKASLSQYVFDTCIGRLANLSTLRAYYQDRDVAYNRVTKPKLDKNGERDKDQYRELVVPVVVSQVKSVQAALNGIFTSRTPMFQAIAGKEFIDEASIINALNTRYSNLWKWRRNISLAIGDGLRYNLMACEVDWKEHKRFTYAKGPATQGESRKLTETVWAGTAITRCDPYNTVFDTRVNPAEMHMHGEFAGYIEFYSKARFEKFWHEDREILYTDKKPTIMANTNVRRNYFVPSLGSGSDARTDNATDWAGFWEDNVYHSAKNSFTGDYSYGVEVLKIYVRIVPDDHGINVPDGKRPQIWQLMYAGDALIHASQYIADHNFIPMLFGQPSEDGLGYQTRSLAEAVEDTQSLSSTLWNAEILATRRVVSDRGIYDPNLIAEKHINDPNSSAKIPLRRAAYNTSPAAAYYQIPYNDPSLGLRLQQSSAVFNFANQITGRNPVAQGQFVKGNKTNEQFQESMAASESRIIDMAILLEDQFFAPLKDMLLSNILEHQPPDELFDATTKELFKVNPERLRDVNFEFEVADGLFGPDKVSGLVAFTQSFQASLAIPAVAMEYDVAGALSYIAELSGAKNFKDFKLTKEQKLVKAQEQANLQGTVAAGNAAGQQAGTNAANNALPPQQGQAA